MLQNAPGRSDVENPSVKPQLLRLLSALALLTSLAVAVLPPAGVESAAQTARLEPAVAFKSGDGQHRVVQGVGEFASLRRSLQAEPLTDTLDAARLAAQDLSEQATLETRQPEVQWSAAAAADWQTVPTRQAVRAGDRARTGPAAAARLVYFEGTVTELGPGTGLLV